MRFKTAVTCQTHAKIKNICHLRLFDLEYKPPTQAQDKALVLQNEAPTGGLNTEFYTQNMEGSVCRMLKFEESAIDHPRILPVGG